MKRMTRIVLYIFLCMAVMTGALAVLLIPTWQSQEIVYVMLSIAAVVFVAIIFTLSIAAWRAAEKKRAALPPGGKTGPRSVHLFVVGLVESVVSLRVYWWLAMSHHFTMEHSVWSFIIIMSIFPVINAAFRKWPLVAGNIVAGVLVPAAFWLLFMLLWTLDPSGFLR